MTMNTELQPRVALMKILDHPQIGVDGEIAKLALSGLDSQQREEYWSHFKYIELPQWRRDELEQAEEDGKVIEWCKDKDDDWKILCLPIEEGVARYYYRIAEKREEVQPPAADQPAYEPNKAELMHAFQQIRNWVDKAEKLAWPKEDS